MRADTEIQAAVGPISFHNSQRRSGCNKFYGLGLSRYQFLKKSVVLNLLNFAIADDRSNGRGPTARYECCGQLILVTIRCNELIKNSFKKCQEKIENFFKSKIISQLDHRRLSAGCDQQCRRADYGSCWSHVSK